MIHRPRFLGPALVLMLGLAALLWRLDAPSTAWVERVYARELYPLLASVIVPIFGAVPISVMGLVLVMLPFGLVGMLIWSFRRRRSFWAWLWSWLWRLAAGGLVAYALFVLLWGANYRREPVEVLLDLPAGSVSPQDVEALGQGLLGVVIRDAPGPGARNEEEALAAIRRSLEAVVRNTTGVSPTLPRGLKRLPPGMLLTFGNAGVISPWTLEPHIDGALPAPAELAVGAHELAHVAGFAGEADADLVAALAGLQADDEYARYATALRLFAQLAPQLDGDAYAALYERLPAEAKDDLEAMGEAAQRYLSPSAVRVVQGIYDRYLKAQGVEAGLQDYSRTITLLTHA
ncbi:MAG TPA: DUF3810 family protein, partial [Trueperaceae bacterium]